MPAPRLKILHVVFSLEPGGMENGIVNLARHLPAAEFETHVCCLEIGGAFVRRLPHPERVVALNKPHGFSLRAVLGLARTIARIGPHMVHSHNLGPLTYTVLATMFGRWKPILHGEHGVFQGDQTGERRLRQRRRWYRCCRKVHTVSTALRSYLVEHGFPAEKIVAIPNGVDTDRFCPADRLAVRRALNLPAAGPVFGVVGRLEPNKRHLLLLESFHEIADALPTAQLLIVGDQGSEREAVRRAVQASPHRARIRLAGFQADPIPWYQAMDLLVAPSVYEGLSNAVLEAMACGVPVLAHTACGNAEVIRPGEDGFLAALDGTAQLARELRQATIDPARLEAMARRARERVQRDFSLPRMVEQYAQVYRGVAAVNSPLREARPRED